MSNIEALRAKLRDSAAKGDQTTKSRGSGGDNASYPFWDMQFNSSAVVRFLPDKDKTNDYFWVKREVIKLPFSGVVGGDFPTDRDVTVTVPCIDMFGMKCPIIAATRHLWDKEETKDQARIYYKKRSYIFQGLVVNSPLTEENLPENPIRRFVINKSIYDKIYEALLDPDLADMPTDYVGGRDFTIKKTKKGDWANYDSSKFSLNPRSLSEADLAAIDTHGLFDLKEALGAIPSADAIEAMKGMLKDSQDGQPYDMESYGQYFRPYGARDGGNGAAGGNAGNASNAASNSTPQQSQTPAQAETPAESGGLANPNDVLSKLRALSAQRQNDA